ncbi:GTP-binding protein [Paenibacillus hamazuiensis]|uniref:GTP-binding protein n=1 Tax=Paenibacillus hamazuiensis TaxID=2936508 RepID=UPI00200BB04A
MWLSEHGADTFRYKGALNIKGVKQRVVFQGIHMLFDSTADREWKPGEAKRSEFVVIGRNLDEAWFKSSLPAASPYECLLCTEGSLLC